MKAMMTAFLSIVVIGVVAGVILHYMGPTSAEYWQADGGAVRLEGEPVRE